MRFTLLTKEISAKKPLYLDRRHAEFMNSKKYHENASLATALLSAMPRLMEGFMSCFAALPSNFRGQLLAATLSPEEV
jgi:hypothetical protein